MKTALILYELQQLESLDALIGQQEEPFELVSLDAEIDYALEKRGLPFISGKTLQNRSVPDAYLRADEITRTMCESGMPATLQYRGVSLLTPLRLSIHIYFINLLYYIDLITRLVEKYSSITHLVVPASTTPVSKTSSFLASHGVFVVVDATREVAESRGITFRMVQSASVSVRVGNKLQKLLFSLKRNAFGAGLAVLNAFMLVRPRRAVRILASDYWRNIAPTMQKLPEAELILIDRSEALKAGFANIWRHQMRFVHIEHFLSGRAREEARQYAKTCLEAWQLARASAWSGSDMTFRGVSLAPVCEKLMTRLMERAIPQVTCDISGAQAMYESLTPDAVLLRASVSEQLHFSILPLVAQSMDIPALEVQHGIEYLGPGSATRQHPAHFFAAYGPLVCDEFRALGYAEERLLSVGSPRFDAYVRDVVRAPARQMGGIFTILSNTPTMSIGERYGTYSIEEYFKGLGAAVRDISSARLLVASRSASFRHALSEEARIRGLEGVAYESVGDAPLPGLFQQSDVFICSYSTVAYEAMLYRLPVVLAAFAPTEGMMADFHFSRFVEAGTLLIAHSPEELADILQKLSSDPEARIRMSNAGEAFMKEQFSFDGHGAERIARLVRDWSTRRL